MSVTLTDEMELIGAGQGGGTDTPAGGDDGDSGRAGPAGVPRRAYFTVVSLALVAILMFFMALTSSYIVRKGLGGDWQPVILPRVLWLNTIVLLVSSATLEVARRALRLGFSGHFRRWWTLTTALGFVFLFGQIVAWRQLSAAGVFLASNPSSSFFYVLTASHGLHLLGGIVALLYVAFRAWQRSRITQATAAELTAIYWHFMDGLWVFLYLLLQVGR